MSRLDDWILSHPPEPPDEALHEACEGEGCQECGHTGIDPVWASEAAEQERLADEAMYEAHLRDWSE